VSRFGWSGVGVVLAWGGGVCGTLCTHTHTCVHTHIPVRHELPLVALLAEGVDAVAERQQRLVDVRALLVLSKWWFGVIVVIYC
jgi:hypothetical protein